jgi:UDP-glucose 4-epimerase
MTKRIVVAGGSGFIGRYVLGELQRRNYVAKVVDLIEPPAALAEPLQSEFVVADLREKSEADAALAGAEVCILLAARSAGIGYFNSHPGQMLDDNIRILASDFEAAKRHQFKQLIYISSSCIFDNSPAYPVNEEALQASPAPDTGYPFSKLAGEFYCRAFQQEFGLSYTILRPFNVYGHGELPGARPGDSHVIPDLAQKIVSGQYPIEIFGDGEQTRSFTHVLDVAKGIVLAIGNEHAINEDFNLGYPSEITILKLAQKMWYLSGQHVPFAYHSVPGFKIDVRRRAVDISKARNVLGWEPAIALDEGLKAYLDWFMNLPVHRVPKTIPS